MNSKKPFACPFQGCNLSFTNEDHLSVHKKKHEMMLNLGISCKNNIFIVDQTPTPTRFIKHCEDVGLFQDLSSENPFEDTFRRAVESSKNNASLVSEININDENTNILKTSIVLHSTVNIDDYSTDVKKNQSPTSEKIENIKLSGKTKVIVVDDDIKKFKEKLDKQTNLFNSVPSSALITNETVHILLKTDDGRTLRLAAEPVDNNLPNEVKNSAKILTFDRSPTLSQENFIKRPKISQSTKIRLKKLEAKKHNIAESTQETKKCSSKIHQSNIDKKKDILERNRASSMRSRAKRKAWIEKLQNSLDIANANNLKLQTQVDNLQNQVIKLKNLLLAHKDCQINISDEYNICEKPQMKNVLEKQNLLSNSPIAHATPTIKPISKPLIKNITILPKNTTSTTPTTLQNITPIHLQPSSFASLLTRNDNSQLVLQTLPPILITKETNKT